MTLRQAQRALTRYGGARERRAPVHRMTLPASNVLDCFAEDGAHLGQLAFRPFEPRWAATGGLFICG